ncbi:Hypothetical protein CINCED_3A001130 [Cinara cedri]|uniref:MULE transposase domain-containing protein n=1 Tax=Cinara cedri TaxID=506608 RepID=A0A5E4MYY9_9HEMI|nr:Hypothetical protein CINCED_3A001130 [Cinara cedri]
MNFNEELISNDLFLTPDGIPFVMYDSLYDENHRDHDSRIILLTTNYNFELLRKCNYWLGFGYQFNFGYLFTINVVLDLDTVSVVYVIIPNSSLDSFKLLFKTLKRYLPPSSYPVSFIFAADELAGLSALKLAFPNVSIRPSMVHFSNVIWDRLYNETNLPDMLGSNLKIKLDQLMTLTYSPVDDIVKNYERLLASEYFTTHAELLEVVIHFFEERYIGRRTRPGYNMRAEPKYPLEVWHCGPANRLRNEEFDNRINQWYKMYTDFLNGNLPNSLSELVRLLKSDNHLNKEQVESMLFEINRFHEEIAISINGRGT